MHVLMMMPADPQGGARAMMNTLTKSLKAQGHQVAIASVAPDGISISEHQVEFLWAKGFLVQGQALTQWVRDHQVDVIHTHLNTYLLGAWVGWKTHRPTVRTLHGRLNRPGMLAPLERYRTQVAVRVFGQKLVAVAQPVTQDILAAYHLRVGESLFEIPNGIDVPTVLPERRTITRDLHIFYAGRLEEAKGFHHLLYAMVRLQRDGLPFRLTIAGDGPLKREISEDLLTTGNITVTDRWVSRDQIQAYLTTSDVFCLPSYTEGLSMALLEAMARGVVPVVSEAATTNDLVVHGQNGFVVKTGSTEALCDGLKVAWEQRVDWDGIRRSAYETVRDRFSADRMATQYVNLYARLCATQSKALTGRVRARTPSLNP